LGEKRDRDVEKVYSTAEFVAKLRRLADALEAGERFEIRVAGRGSTCRPVPSSTSSTSGRGTRRRSSSSSSGPTREFPSYSYAGRLVPSRGSVGARC
jgi:hypothetical protein